MPKLSEEDIERIVTETVTKVLENLRTPVYVQPLPSLPPNYQPYIGPKYWTYNPYDPLRVTC